MTDPHVRAYRYAYVRPSSYHQPLRQVLAGLGIRIGGTDDDG